MQRGRCNKPNVGDADWLIDNSGPGRDRRKLALAFCQICPVQWDCTAFAIDTGDRWHTCGSQPGHRRAIQAHPNWREILVAARDARVSVVDLARQFNCTDED